MNNIKIALNKQDILRLKIGESSYMEDGKRRSFQPGMEAYIKTSL
jgi:hypothetical protein